jgi:hypothetical protein
LFVIDNGTLCCRRPLSSSVVSTMVLCFFLLLLLLLLLVVVDHGTLLCYGIAEWRRGVIILAFNSRFPKRTDSQVLTICILSAPVCQRTSSSSHSRIILSRSYRETELYAIFGVERVYDVVVVNFFSLSESSRVISQSLFYSLERLDGIRELLGFLIKILDLICFIPLLSTHSRYSY